MRFVGGRVQGEFVERVRGEDPESCLLVPVDVGKRRAEAMVADLYGQVVDGPFGFALDEPGVSELLGRVDAARADRGAVFCRFGVEACGHYHRLLVWRLIAGDRQVVELNPGHVKEARAQQGRRRVKTDHTDLAAMVSLLSQGAGRIPQRRSDALAVQRIWVAHRDRTVKARSGLGNQILGLVDQAFPSLTDCYWRLLAAKSARVIIGEICDPDRIRRLGAKRLRRFVVNRGVVMRRPKAEKVVAAYKAQLVARDKHPKVINIAVGRRAHRLAFAMMRDQTLYDPAAWQAGVEAGRSVMDDTWSARCDVTVPPASSVTNDGEEHNTRPEPMAVQPVPWPGGGGPDRRRLGYETRICPGSRRLA